VEKEVSFGRLLKRLRKVHDVTQEALAQQAYCAVDTIRKIEAGLRRPSRQLAAQFADCLGLVGDERAAFLAAARAVDTDIAIAPGAKAAIADVALVPTHRGRLPHQPTSFIGRAHELADLSRLLEDEQTRLVTITGPGGIGKTRLAITLAERLLAADRFPDGVFFVPLAAIETADQIVPALAEALDFSLDAGRNQVRSPQQQVFDYLRAKRLMLILDNVEHLLGSAEVGDDKAADWVATLLAAAPGVAIVATSREHLKLREEHVYPLGGLDVPGAGASSAYGAVALFVQRAQLLRPDFAPDKHDMSVVAQICRLVEGMPLAIELAAGWVDTLALPAIAMEIERDLDLLATELRDVPPRHRNMRTVFDATWHRLGAAEQMVFARLAVFRGGSDRQGVQSVTGALLPQLHTLVGGSLLQYDATRDRYSVHELLRQYGSEKLAADAADERATRDRHAAYYCAFVQQRGAELSGRGQLAALAALDAERENVQAAWDWAATRGQIKLLVEAIDGLGYFYEWRALFDNGARAYHIAAQRLEALPADDQAYSRRVLTRLHAWQGTFHHLQGDTTGAEQLLRQSLALLDNLSASGQEVRAERAFILLQLGRVDLEGKLVDARRYLEESLALYQALGRRWEASHVLLWLGELARGEGAFEEGRRYCKSSLAGLEASGDRRGIAEVLDLDSQAAVEVGQLDEAEALARRSYAIRAELGDSVNRAAGLGRLGVFLLWAGKNDEASTLLAQSLELYQELGDRTMIAGAQTRLAIALRCLGHYDAAWDLNQQATIELRQLRLGWLTQALWNSGSITLARGRTAMLSFCSRRASRSAGNADMSVIWAGRWRCWGIPTGCWAIRRGRRPSCWK
jgi:predicted ATPase/DNA-binding XRE family transcriptional regulator